MSIVAKKKFSQNFLTNPQMQKKICDCMQALVQDYPDLSILEIGPGKGDLTENFLRFDRKLIGLEIDPDLIFILQKKFSLQSNFSVYQKDALALLLQPNQLISLVGSNQFCLLSNLPFNVGSRILMDLPIHFPTSPFAVILQKEVIQKLSKSSNFTLFGSFLNLFYDFKIKFDIGSGSFTPAPDVLSSLVLGYPKAYPMSFLETVQQRNTVRLFLKKLTAHPRKSISNNIKYANISGLQTDNFLQKLNFKQINRLTWQNYQEVIQLFCESLGAE